jgi:DUF1680 family protein
MSRLFKNIFPLSITCLSLTLASAQKKVTDYPIQPVAFTKVHLTDDFWAPRLETNAKVTIPYILDQLRIHGRVDNFLIAAHKKKGKLSEYPFDDTDLYKLIEGASYSLQEKYDAKLDRELDTLISIIGAAQEPDGYLYTFRTAEPDTAITNTPHDWIGSKRWEKDSVLSHELYNCGHLYESAVAHYQATGKKTFLNVAIKNADLLVKTFGPNGIHEYPGHQIVELGLVKMYRVTGKEAYLKLAKFFLDVRGPGGEAYNQADKKVINQRHAEGHAVRAAYMYTGMADVAALTNDEGYLDAIDTIWNDVADKKLYITGGIGATGDGEAFGEAYDLPNMSAYAETCAAIGNVYWNQRMFLLHGDSKYMDVLERTLYNGLLSGISLSGNRFFYPNVLASVGQHQRSGWFNCACCITNMTRFLPSMPGYIYAQNDNDLYVNLYVSSNANIKLKSTEVQLIQQTEYPWQGKVNITVEPTKTTAFTMHVRIPGWATDQPVTTSDLYSFMGGKLTSIPVYVNGEKINYIMQKGYAIINRIWKKDDKITIDFPMNVQKITANDKVKADNGRLALQRGPIVYCLEGVDQKDSGVQSLVADTNAVINTLYNPNKLNGITELTFAGYAVSRNAAKDIVKKEQTLTAIPYYSWNNRGSGEMEVWIPFTENKAKPKAAPSIASKSTVTSSAKNKLMLKAVNDQYEPLDSKDQSLNYLHWWPAKDTMEWVQYDFDKAYSISQSKVYWYDDKPFGGCDLPASWKLLYKKGDEWIPVDTTTTYEIAKDKYNTVEFKPVTTTALRLVIQLPKNDASGIHEWIVE